MSGSFEVGHRARVSRGLAGVGNRILPQRHVGWLDIATQLRPHHVERVNRFRAVLHVPIGRRINQILQCRDASAGYGMGLCKRIDPMRTQNFLILEFLEDLQACLRRIDA